MNALNNIFSIVGMIGFAAAWYWGDIYIATMFLMAMFTAQLAALSLARRALHKPSLYIWLLVMFLGGLTLLLREKAFIQLKTSVVYGGFALALLVSAALGKNLPRMLLEKFFNAPDIVWRRVSNAAAGYCALLSACNYLVAKYLSEAQWVGIKTFGFPAATVVFTTIMVACLYRYMRDDSEIS